MKITFVLPNLNLSGGTRIVADHAHLLHVRGHDVTVASSVRRRPRLRDRFRTWAKGQAIAGNPETSHLDGAAYRVIMTDRPRAVAEDDLPDADVILATWWETAEWVSRMPLKKGVQVNFLQGYEAHPGQPKDRVDAVWRLPMRKIVVSEWLNQVSRDQFDDQTALLVPNGLNTRHFQFVDRGPSGRMVVGTVASPTACKRFPLAAETVRRLHARGSDCRFVGFGSDVSRASWMPDGSRFEVTPAQKRIAEIYASCDCWLFTSDKEGYGLPILEAMACGTPVVATPAGAAPELLASGGGILVDSDDPEVLSDAVERVLSMDEDSWRAMSRAARAEAEKHSWDVIGDRMEKALMQILEESRAG